jgi:hypothetical protein
MRPTTQAAWDMYAVLFRHPKTREALDAAAVAVGKTPKDVDATAKDYIRDRRKTTGPADGGPAQFDDPGLRDARLDVIDRLEPSHVPGTKPKQTARAIAAVLGQRKAQYRRRSERGQDAADRGRAAWVAAFGEVICQGAEKC